MATGNFTFHPTEAIKLYYKERIQVDLLLFGEIEDPNRKVDLKDPKFIFKMPCFKEIYPFVNDIIVDENFAVKVCTTEGIILLNLISKNDTPQRTKDISDIEHIIKVYFDLYSGDIYEEHFDVMDLYDTNKGDYLQLVCSRIIGRKIQGLKKNSNELSQQIEQILANRPTTWWKSMLEGMRVKVVLNFVKNH